MATTTKEVMDIEGLGKYLQLAPVTLYKMVKEEKIPYRRIGKSLRFPKAVPEDVYIYMALKKSGLRFVKTYEAVAYMRNVANFGDRLKQARKYHSGKGSLENYFPPDSLKREYAIPRLQMFQTFVGFFLRKPVWIALYFFDVLLVRSLLWAGGRRKFQPLYEPYYSSKDLTA